MEPIPNDVFDKVPKIIWENARVAFNDKFFLVAIKNGLNIGVQAATPEHMKQIVQMLQYNLKEYEEKFGEIKAEWTPNAKSPIQIAKPQS